MDLPPQIDGVPAAATKVYGNSALPACLFLGEMKAGITFEAARASCTINFYPSCPKIYHMFIIYLSPHYTLIKRVVAETSIFAVEFALPHSRGFLDIFSECLVFIPTSVYVMTPFTYRVRKYKQYCILITS